jgi:membrane carboxypeptidase/penicillin-binding protein PbpC
MDLDHDSGYYGYGIVLGGVELTLENIVEVYTSLSDTTDPSRFLLFDILSRGENRARTF